MTAQDKYFKLLPPEPTPEDEMCHCPGTPPIKLMYVFGYNPIHCMNCNLEVQPEKLGIPSDLVAAIDYWRHLYQAIDALWLDSSDYEQWAEEQLSDISSRVNRKGRSVQQSLNSTRRCYYWYFQDQSADDYEPISSCPSCGNPLSDYSYGIFRQLVCEKCSIVTVGE
jgi:predicted  nucleic acid-binding Zn ribbon protein